MIPRHPLLLVASLGLLAAAPPAQELRAPDDPEGLRLRQQHYGQAVRELRAAAVPHLDPARRLARQRALDVLAAYAERGDFGVHHEPTGGRLPIFVDRDGRRCAVAEILHAFGEDALVERVARSDNYVWVHELAEDPELARALDRLGLAFEEAVRIQGPGWANPDDGPPQVPMPPMPVPNGPIGRPGPELPPAPGTPSGAGPGAPAPLQPGSPAPTGPGSLGAGPTASVPMSGASPEGLWWLWWETNKLEFLQPRRFALLSDLAVSPDQDVFPGAVLRRLREEAAPVLRAALDDPSLDVRAAAAVSYARVVGADAVDELAELLHDPSQAVRRAALLGLGATGSEEAAAILLSVATDGVAPGRADRVGPQCRPLAIVALGLARRSGLDASWDARVAPFADGASGADAREVELAVLVYQRLSPADALFEVAQRVSGDRREPIASRARAAEVLHGRADAETLAQLADLTSGRDLELRRSAGLALGLIDNELALPLLMTALETEKEPLTRGFLAVSIGRRGGDEAVAFLGEQLERGPKTLRPWAAIGLGLAADAGDDDAARATIREAYERERNVDQRGAYLLALGIAGDTAAAELLSAELTESRSARTRMHAGLALALSGAEGSRDLLRTAWEEEANPITRIHLAQALGVVGDARDAEAVVASLAELDDAGSRVLAAVAGGLHGSHAVLQGCLALAGDEAAGPIARASAVESVGLMLARTPGLELARTSMSSNFAVFPPWLVEALGYSL